METSDIERVLEVIQFVESELGETKLAAETTFDSLKMDSLDFVDLILQAEKKFKVSIPQTELPRLHSIRDLALLIGEYALPS